MLWLQIPVKSTGVKLYDNAKILKEIFSPVTPEFGSLKNPVDVTGQARSFHYDSALDAALQCDGIDSVISLYCETTDFDADQGVKDSGVLVKGKKT